MMDHLDARLAADLWFFRVAAEEQSFSRASDVLAVTQSAVTQRIQRLEARLKVTLFHRDNRGLQLTAAGLALFERTRAGFDTISLALREVRTAAGLLSLNVNCAPSLALEWLTPRLPKFTASHPGISVALFVEMHHLDSVRMAADGIDVAIRYGPEPPSGVVVAFDYPELLFPVASPSLREEYETVDFHLPTTLLHDATPWAHARSPTIEWAWWLKAHSSPWGRPFQNRFFNLAHLTYQSAIHGAGVALGRALIVKSHVSAGRLVAAVDAEPIGGARYYALTRTAPADAPVNQFVSWLHHEMSI